MKIYKDQGVVFPVSPDGKSRSSTEGGKRIVAASVQSVDPALAASASAEKNWRYNYPQYYVENVKRSLQSPEEALRIAEAGLEEVHRSFQFVREGKAYSFASASQTFAQPLFESRVIEGNRRNEPADTTLKMPYGTGMLTGKGVMEQLSKWADKGTIGPDVLAAVERILASPDQYFTVTDRYFVLLGASSEMGPLENLLDLGADIIAIDLPGRPQVWTKLIDYAANSRGTLTIPVVPFEGESTHEAIAQHAGADLLLQTPEIITWLSSFAAEKHCTIGSYTYLDSDLFARIAVAGDWIAQQLIETFPGKLLEKFQWICRLLFEMSCCRRQDIFGIPVLRGRRVHCRRSCCENGGVPDGEVMAHGCEQVNSWQVSSAKCT